MNVGTKVQDPQGEIGIATRIYTEDGIQFVEITYPGGDSVDWMRVDVRAV